MRHCSRVLAALVLSSLGVSAAAQEFPNRPMRIIIPFPPGGTTDILGRIVGERMNQAWKVPVLSDNRAGAGGVVGVEAAAKAPPDGYTMLVYTIAMTTWPVIHKQLSFDAVRDFVPLSNLTLIPSLLVMHPSVPARTVKELVALMKARPGQLNYATTGAGTSPHLFMEMFRAATGTSVVHVPYKGGAPAMVDLMAGQVEMGFTTVLPVVPFVKDKKLIALAVSTKQRFPILPDVPTMHESGVRDFDASSWVGMVAPRGTPPDIAVKLSTEIRRILDQPEIRERLLGLGGIPAGSTSEEFGKFIQNEATKWQKVAIDAKLKAE